MLTYELQCEYARLLFNFGDGQVQLFDTYEDAKKHLKGLIDPEEYEVREHEMIYIETGSIGENPKFKGMNSGEVCNVYTDGSSREMGSRELLQELGYFMVRTICEM